MGNYIVIVFAAGIIIFGLIRKIDVFDAFSDGAREGLNTAVRIMPVLTALTLSVSMLRASGAVDAIAQTVAPLLQTVGIPSETLPLMLIRPISGSGAIAVLKNIFDACGPDSNAGLIASVMMGSTETTFYTITVYFGSIGLKKTGCTLPAALTADLTGMIFAALTVNLFHSF